MNKRMKKLSRTKKYRVRYQESLGKIRARRNATFCVFLFVGFVMLYKEPVLQAYTGRLAAVVVGKDYITKLKEQTITPTEATLGQVSIQVETSDSCSSQDLFENPNNFASCVRDEPTPSCGKNDNLETWEDIMKARFGKHKGTCLSNTVLNGWNGPSGIGSSVRIATPLIEFLNELLAENTTIIEDGPIRTFLDCPCGDWVWMQEVKISPPSSNVTLQYFGGDITRTVIDENSRCFQRPNVHFHQLDWTCKVPPPVDLFLVRDILFHLPTATNIDILRQINKSGGKYLLTTTFPNISNPVPENLTDDRTTLYRNINLYGPPYNFPEPIHIVWERENSGRMRQVGLWKLPITTFDDSIKTIS